MKHAHILTLLAALLLAPLAAIKAAESPPKPTAQVLAHLPAFSWDTVPTAMPPRKRPPFTDEDYSRMARHCVVAGSEAMEIAGEIKKFNPEITAIGYKNLVLHVQGADDQLFKDHPDWFLYDSPGKPKLNGGGKNKRPHYDLRKPEVREYWVQDVMKMMNDPHLDGVFLDAYAKVVALNRSQGTTDYMAGYHAMMDELCKRRANINKILVGNFLRADKEECAIPEVMKYLDGSYLEAFERDKCTPPGPQTYEAYVALGIEAVQQVARSGKIILLRLSAVDKEGVDEAGDAVGGDKGKANASRSYYKNVEYKLALFLICAERYSYFSYYTPAPAKTSEELAPDLPEFKKPLGPPKGPAVKNGFTYRREFQYASVWLDLTKRQGRITWKASYPQLKTLSPRHGDDQVPVGALECRIEFDRAIKKGAGTISLHRLSDRQKLASVLVESDAVLWPDDKTVIVRFPAGVEAKTQYSITVDKGAFLDGKNMKFLGMPVLGEWRFTTRSQQ